MPLYHWELVFVSSTLQSPPYTATEFCGTAQIYQAGRPDSSILKKPTFGFLSLKKQQKLSITGLTLQKTVPQSSNPCPLKS